MVWFLRFLLPLLLLISAARANDSTAELAVGGLILTNSKAISLDREDLYISEKIVRVDYVFTNTSAADIDTLVAFPFPDQVYKDEDDFFLQGLDAATIKTVVDGKPVKLVYDRRAVLNGIDITTKVQKLKLPLASNGDDFQAAVRVLAPDELKALLQEGVIRKREWSEAPLLYFPGWTLQSYYTRHQFFPAGKSVKVQHSYVPIVGGSVGGNLDPKNRNEDYNKQHLARFCPTETFFKAFDRQLAKSKPGDVTNYGEIWLGYVLKSGANWKGPIKDFRLVVDTGNPQSLVSFCEAGVKKIAPTQYEVRKRNFEPTRDLDILIVKWSE